MKNSRTWFNREQAAAYIGMKPGTLTIWASTGRYNLPCYHVGNRVRYKREDLDAWLESRRTVDTGDLPRSVEGQDDSNGKGPAKKAQPAKQAKKQPAAEAVLQKIAEQVLGIDISPCRHQGSFVSHELVIGLIQQALQAAYEAGRAAR